MIYIYINLYIHICLIHGKCFATLGFMKFIHVFKIYKTFIKAVKEMK